MLDAVVVVNWLGGVTVKRRGGGQTGELD